ncbi:MAG TPA: carboxypeptidase regulatory-like domain-containing protein [Bryobacteraceae bacterium]|jgi:hypothetical protein
MTAKQKTAVWSGGALSLAVVVLGALFIIRQSRPNPPYLIAGVVLVDDKDPQKQSPIGYATVTATSSRNRVSVRGDATGLFTLSLPPSETANAFIRLHAWSAGYKPRDFIVHDPKQLQILRLESATRAATKPVAHPVLISNNVRVRYSEQSAITNNVGSVSRPFQIVNTGNVPCDNHAPCSPDGKWKASIGSIVVEGQGGEFRNIRLSCIAGPCPFSRVESETPVDNGRNLKVSVRNWSDPVTWLLEAEVTQTRPIEIVREAYAAIFGSSMNFTLPASARGASIEAEVGGHDIIYPLGPNLLLSWAVCSEKTTADGTKQFHCDLKPEYRFKQP